MKARREHPLVSEIAVNPSPRNIRMAPVRVEGTGSQFEDLEIEIDPKEDRLLTVKSADAQTASCR
jgi:hypothetical protein